jgi:hypothetical protein
MNLNWTARLNPELVRSLRITLPPRRVLFIAVFTIILLIVTSGLVWNNALGHRYLTSAQQIKKFGGEMYWLLGLTLFALLFILTPATAALSFIQEKIRGTYIFQQMVLLSPFDLAVGKFLGSGLLGYFLAAIVYPFFLAAAALAEADFFQLVRLSLFLLIGGLCCQAVGLFISAALSGPSNKFLRGGLLVSPATGCLGGLLALALNGYFVRNSYSSLGSYHESGYFYGFKTEAYLVVLGLLAFTGAWAFAGTVRRIRVSQLTPVRPWPAWLFFASAEAVLTGLFWGGFTQANSTRYFLFPPVARLCFYLLLNWAAFIILAGSSALSRGRLREWWSESCDPFAVFERHEIKNAITTFVLALGISLVGLVALWASFHTYTPTRFVDGSDVPQLVAIALAFTLTVAAVALFIQYCAMQRFRIGAWAGVALAIVFYMIVGIIGASFEDKKNTAALLNPLVYTTVITDDNPYMDSHDSFGDVLHQPDLEITGATLAHGLIAEGLLALACFGLAYAKCRKTEEEILQERV